jgi:hypothetical protein
MSNVQDDKDMTGVKFAKLLEPEHFTVEEALIKPKGLLRSWEALTSATRKRFSNTLRKADRYQKEQTYGIADY